MRPILLEDFLNETQQDLNSVEEGIKLPAALVEQMQDNFEKLQDPLLKDDNLRQKLHQLMKYIEPIPHLPGNRQKTRIKNARLMIQKLRDWFLIEEYECRVPFKTLETPVKYAKGVGPKREAALKRLGMETLKDLIFYFPRDYEDRRKIIPISELLPNEKATTMGKIIAVEKRRVSGMTLITAVLGEREGFQQILLKWFNQEYLFQSLRTLRGKIVLAIGAVKHGSFGSLEMINPEIETYDSSENAEILPIYSLTEGISQKQLRKIMRENVNAVCNLSDELPEELMKKRKLMDIRTAMAGMHFPKTMYHLQKSRERLAYEELFLMQLALLISKRKRIDRGGFSKHITGHISEKFLKKLPFSLTNSQVRAHTEIRKDMQSTKPMNRLLQGDVGSGKTVVAQLALLDNFEAGFQAAFMVPTSILAIQHFRRMFSSFQDLGIKTSLLLGGTSQSEKNKIKSALAKGQVDIVVGTHTLIQEDVQFKNLGLVVIDEQHRFGVKQREALVNKGKVVDSLVMTATPIPRTLAMTVYGDLDISTIDEMPPNRQQVKTILASVTKLSQIYDFVKREVQNGSQAFIVYPLIEESEKIQAKAATEMYEHLSNKVFPSFKLGLLHGRMNQEEKDRVMENFSKGSYNILVSTTVIEVGIDIPKATVMVIENPERFGLAQLHQLRGRVGRAERQGYCFLVVGNVDSEAMERLKYFSSTVDGFRIAEYDMRLRGPGELIGLRQHGIPELKVADLVKDKEILINARKDAEHILQVDSNMERHSELYTRIVTTYGERLKFVEIG